MLVPKGRHSSGFRDPDQEVNALGARLSADLPWPHDRTAQLSLWVETTIEHQLCAAAGRLRGGACGEQQWELQLGAGP